MIGPWRSVSSRSHPAPLAAIRARTPARRTIRSGSSSPSEDNDGRMPVLVILGSCLILTT